MRRAKWRDSSTEARRRAALTSPRGLSAQPPGRAGLGAEAWASEVGSQGEDWGWQHEHSLKGLVRHGYPGGSPGKSLELPKRRETSPCLFVSWCARRGDSERRLKELQRRARAAVISVDPRDGHETLGLLQPPPKSLCASTGHIHTAPPRSRCSPPLPASVIQGQLPRENARSASGWCNVTTPLPPQARPASVPLPPPA